MASFIYDTRSHTRDEFWTSTSPHSAEGSDQCMVKILEWPSGEYLPYTSILEKPLTHRSPFKYRTKCQKATPKTIKAIEDHVSGSTPILGWATENSTDSLHWILMIPRYLSVPEACKPFTNVSECQVNSSWNDANPSPIHSARTWIQARDRRPTVSQSGCFGV